MTAEQRWYGVRDDSRPGIPSVRVGALAAVNRLAAALFRAPDQSRAGLIRHLEAQGHARVRVDELDHTHPAVDPRHGAVWVEEGQAGTFWPSTPWRPS